MDMAMTGGFAPWSSPGEFLPISNDATLQRRQRIKPVIIIIVITILISLGGFLLMFNPFRAMNAKAD